MKLAKSRLLRCAVGGLVLVPLGACTVAASLLSPDLAASLGITTASQGVVLVAFKNDTSSPIIFSAFAGFAAS